MKIKKKELPKLEYIQLEKGIENLGFQVEEITVLMAGPKLEITKKTSFFNEVVCTVLPDQCAIDFYKNIPFNGLELISLLEQYYDVEFDVCIRNYRHFNYCPY